MKKPATKTQIKSWIEKNIDNLEWKSKYIDNIQMFVDYIKKKEEQKDFPYTTWGEKKAFNFSLTELRILMNEPRIDDIVDIHYIAGTLKIIQTKIKTKKENPFKNWNGDY